MNRTGRPRITHCVPHWSVQWTKLVSPELHIVYHTGLSSGPNWSAQNYTLCTTLVCPVNRTGLPRITHCVPHWSVRWTKLVGPELHLCTTLVCPVDQTGRPRITHCVPHWSVQWTKLVGPELHIVYHTGLSSGPNWSIQSTNVVHSMVCPVNQAGHV